MLIRSYRNDDFNTVARWWSAASEPVPPPGAMPVESTFVLEDSGRAVMSISVLLTNSNEVAFLENFVADPEFRGPARSEAATMLVEHARSFAKQRGYKRVLCFCYREGLKRRYQELGMTPALDNVLILSREL